MLPGTGVNWPRARRQGEDHRFDLGAPTGQPIRSLGQGDVNRENDNYHALVALATADANFCDNLNTSNADKRDQQVNSAESVNSGSKQGDTENCGRRRNHWSRLGRSRPGRSQGYRVVLLSPPLRLFLVYHHRLCVVRFHQLRSGLR